METDILTDMILNQSSDDDLTEVEKFTTRSNDTRKTKVRRAAGQLATYEGRRKNDPLYKKMVYHRDLYLKYRDLLKGKYRTKNVNKARR